MSLAFSPNLPQLQSFAERAGEDLPQLAELSKWYAEQDLPKVQWPSDDAPLGFASTTYLDKFRSELLATGRFDDDEVGVIMRHARGYAGGVASAAAKKQRSEDEPDLLAANEAYMQLPALGIVGPRLFSDSDAGWMQITPKAGQSFDHPKYGKVSFTRKSAEQMVAHFKNRVYQEHIPVDAEHMTKLSGALGYYRDLRVRRDGAVEAKVELTERGRKLAGEGGFKYFSPEFFHSWTDPATGENYSNLLVGGAFTTRPFFKDQHLAPLAASEGYATWNIGDKEASVASKYQRDAEGGLVLDANGEPQLTAEALSELVGEVAATKATEAMSAFREQNGLTDEVIAGIKNDKSSKAAAFAEQYPEEAAAFAELQRQNRELQTREMTQRYTEITRGRGGENDGGNVWLGDTAKHVTHMIALSEKFGETSDEFKWYVDMNRAHAEQARQSGLFNESGSSARGGEGQAQNTVVTKATELLKSRPELSFGEAINEVLEQNPELYSESLS